MKASLISTCLTFVLLSSGSVYACENLVGTYHCISDNEEQYQLEISKENNVLTLTDDLSRNKVILDGATHRIPDFSNLKNVSYKATCDYNIYKFKMQGHLVDPDTKIAVKLTIDNTINKSNDYLEYTATDTYMGKSQTNTTFCKQL